ASCAGTTPPAWRTARAAGGGTQPKTPPRGFGCNYAGRCIRASHPGMETALKKSLLTVATLFALGLATPATAHEDHACADSACTIQLLYAADEAGGGDTIAPTRYGTWGFDVAGMDRSVRPGVDFFAYANGTWAKNTRIPDDQSSYGSFRALRDLSELRVHKLVESYPLGNPETDGDAAKIAAIYRGFMDEATIEKLDARPLQPVLERVR